MTKKLGNFDWLAVVIYPMAVVLMEAFWVSPWLSWIGALSFFPESRPVLHLPSVIIVIVVSLLITRIFDPKKMPLLLVQIIVIGSGFATMLLVLGVEYADGYTFLSGAWFGHIFRVLGNTFNSTGTIAMAIPAIIYLWWRGIMLGQSTSYFRNIYRSFLLGMGALILLIIFWKISGVEGGGSGLNSEIGLDIIAFFFFGLLAIAVSHLYSMRSTMPKEDAGLTSVWRWMPVMLGVIGGMIVIGFGVAFAISPDFIETIGNGVKTILAFLGTVLGYIITPIIYIVQGFVIALKWFMGLFASDQPVQPEEPGSPFPQDLQPENTVDMPPIVTEIIKWVVVGAIIAAVIFFLARAVARYRERYARENMDEVRESLGGWRAFKDDLALLFKSLGNRFKRKSPAPSPFIYNDEDMGRLDIREIFRHLQWEAGRSGVPRRRHETAAEYARHIEHVMPESRLPLNDLTKMYENVRYGEEIAPIDKLDRANSLWQNLKGLIKKLRGA